MRPCRVGSRLSDLWSKISTEALTVQGTWSLATYREVMALARSFKLEDSSFLVSKTIEALNGTDTSPGARYKLAQLVSSMKANEVPFIVDAFKDHRVTILDFGRRWPRDELTKSALELLLAIVGLQMVRPQSSSPPPVKAVRPTVTRVATRQAACRTPVVLSPRKCFS